MDANTNHHADTADLNSYRDTTDRDPNEHSAHCHIYQHPHAERDPHSVEHSNPDGDVHGIADAHSELDTHCDPYSQPHPDAVGDQHTHSQRDTDAVTNTAQFEQIFAPELAVA